MEDIISGTYFADDSGKIMIVKLQGYIDQTNSYGLQKVFNDIINSECFNVIIDFSEVMYISSAGWGIFVGEIKHFRDEGGDIKLANMSPDIYEVYQMLEFYHIFEDFNSLEEAKKSFNEPELSKVNIPVENQIQEKTLEIDLEEDINNEKSIDNVLDISIGKEETAKLEYQDISTDHQETVSDDIELEIEENSGIEEKSNEDISLSPEEDLNQPQPESKTRPLINLGRLPLHEKIKKIVSEYPLLSIWQIKKLLKDERFGTVKLNIIKLYKLLKQLDLETKIKRYRYYRSC